MNYKVEKDINDNNQNFDYLNNEDTNNIDNTDKNDNIDHSTNQSTNTINKNIDNNFKYNNKKAQNYTYNDNNIMKYSRNITNKRNSTYFNYSNFQNGGYKTNQKLFKNDILFNNSMHSPKAPETGKNKSFKINREDEEEKVSKDNEKYICSLNNQIYKLESQIEQLQNKVCELNTQNKNIDKDKKKLKNYEQIIETERHKVKKAENTIYNLRQEIEMLKKSSNKNIKNISKLKIPKIIK